LEPFPEEAAREVRALLDLMRENEAAVQGILPCMLQSGTSIHEGVSGNCNRVPGVPSHSADFEGFFKTVYLNDNP
jgi:hypothetical protein